MNLLSHPLPEFSTRDKLVTSAAQRALQKVAEPGNTAFRQALRDAIMSTKEVVGTHGVYNFKDGNIYGVDQRARVIVKLDNGAWKLAQ